MNGLGLVSVLHISYYAAVAVLTMTFLGALVRRQVSDRVLLGLVVVLVLILFGLTPILEAVPRFAVAWRHVGIAQAILDTGHIDPRIDAYFNWPGFFALAALFTKLTGYKNPISLASGAPIYFNLLYPVIAYAGGSPVHPWTVYVSAAVHADLAEAVKGLGRALAAPSPT